MFGLTKSSFFIQIAGLGEIPVIRSRRRTLAIHLKPDGIIECRVPLLISSTEVRHFVESKARWIICKQQEENARPALHKPTFCNGEMFPLFGSEYPLKTSSFHGFEDNTFHVNAHSPVLVQEELRKLYRSLALKYFHARSLELATKHNLSFSRLVLSGATRRWGSCNTKGELRLNWRLVMCPAMVVDYVILHELAHTREMNHGKGFWLFLESILPKCRQYRNELKNYSALLSLW